MVAGIVTALRTIAIAAAVLVITDQLGLLPNPAPPDLTGWVSGLSGAWAYAAWANKYFPLDQAALAFGLLFAVWVPMYGLKVTIWIMVKVGILKG